MPVMSSPFPRDRTMSATIPATIKALTVIAEYFTRFNVDGDCISDVSEQRRKEDYDHRCPRAVDRQVIRLPFFEGDERSAPSQEANVEHGGPRQIDQENHVLAQGGHAVRGEAELGDARGDGPQRYRVGQERTDHQHDLHDVEGAWRLSGVTGRYGIAQQAEDQRQKQVEPDQHFALDADSPAGPQ